MFDHPQSLLNFKDRSYTMNTEEDELFDWLGDVYASANNALPTVDLTEIDVTLQNNQIIGIEHHGSSTNGNSEGNQRGDSNNEKMG